MYFKVKKGSETEKRFAVIKPKMEECHDAAEKVAEKYYSESWRQANGGDICFGRMSIILLPSKIDLTCWKRKYDGYAPRLNTKKGKAIQAEFDALPVIKRIELNSCLGQDYECYYLLSKKDGRNHFFDIGVTLHSDEFGFEIKSEFVKDSLFEDCIEITETEYYNLYNK